MTGIKNRSIIAASACTLAVFLAAPASLWAQTAEPLTQSEVAAMGHLVVKAAHFTGQNPRLIRYEVTTPKTYRATYTLTMEYFGKFSGRRYLAVIDVHMDTLGTMEAMRVDYSDNNPYFNANAANLNKVVHQINNVLGSP